MKPAWKRAATAAGLAAAVGGGLAWWRHSSSEVDRAALREEILARIRDRPARASPPREEIPESENAAPLFLRALAAARGVVVPPEVTVSLYRAAWDQPPPGVLEFLEAHAPILALVDEGALRPRCSFPPGCRGWTGVEGVIPVRALLANRASVALSRAQFPAAASDVSLLRRIAGNAMGTPAVPGGISPAMAASTYEWTALLVLERIATAPSLDQAGARAALEAARGPWLFARTAEDLAEESRRQAEEFAAGLLGPDARKVMDAAGMTPARPSLGDAVEHLFRPGQGPSGPSSPSSAGDVRALLACLDAARDAMRRDDRVALAPGGPIWEAEVGTDGEEWPPFRFGGGTAGLYWHRIRSEARLEAARGVLALRIAELGSGRPAASWGEVVPGILDAPPPDPYTGGVLDIEVLPTGGAVRARAWTGTWWWGKSGTELEPVRLEWKRTEPGSGR